MAMNYPIEYEVRPKAVAEGMRWLTLSLKNIGNRELKDLDVRLNSLDTYSILVRGLGELIPTLEPGEEEELPFHVSAQTTGRVYVVLNGRKNGRRFHWESPEIFIRVGEQPAELVSLFALTEPHARLGEPIKCEATVRGLIASAGLVWEFWAEVPGGEFKSLAKGGVGALDAGEEARYTFEITPDREGIYVLHAYLYQGARRIDHRTEYLSISL